MKGTDHVTARLATAADIPPEWIEKVATVLAREGQAYDLARDARSIVVQSINTSQWMPLNLPTNGHLFATQRDAESTYTALAAAVHRLDRAARATRHTTS